MTHLWRRVTPLLFTLWLIALLAARWLAADESYSERVRTALKVIAPCGHQDCFLAIVPGETILEQAMAVLEADERVQDVILDGYGAYRLTYYVVTWRWRESEFFVGRGRLDTQRGGTIVASITLPSRLAFGDVWLVIGRPRAVRVDDVNLVARYDGFTVTALSSCSGFWQAPVTFVLPAVKLYRTSQTITDPLRVACFRTGFR